MTHLNLTSKAKILCTMGPAIASATKVANLVRAGANAFRLNMSHGSHAMHEEFIAHIRAAEQKLGVHLPIVADLQGPKIRVGDFGPDIDVLNLVPGTEVKLADVAVIKAEKLTVSDQLIPVHYATLASDVKKGDALLLDDGLLKLEVRKTTATTVTCLVVHGGELKPRKGINLPHTNVSQPSITSKDRADVRFAIDHQLDYIALSFVRTAQDVDTVRKYIVKNGGTQPVISKIEKPEALDNIEDIIRASDIIMVARGDLGVEIPSEHVPMVQKNIIHLCNQHAVPVITATQMLESMIRAPRPTRAEASDVANAVLDGTDAVMLSAETSVGAYPVEAVHYMRQICDAASTQMAKDERLYVPGATAVLTQQQNTASIAMAAARIANEQRVDAIVSLSHSGETVRLISNRRPNAAILCVTSNASVARRMGLLWGVTGAVVDTASSTDETIEHIETWLVRQRILPVGSTVIFTVGRPLVGRARTNMLSIEMLQPVRK
ncbi:MAG: pyruvate kinase [Candidatus Kapaibacteriota bacterium]